VRRVATLFISCRFGFCVGVGEKKGREKWASLLAPSAMRQGNNNGKIMTGAMK